MLFQLYLGQITTISDKLKCVRKVVTPSFQTTKCPLTKMRGESINNASLAHVEALIAPLHCQRLDGS